MSFGRIAFFDRFIRLMMVLVVVVGLTASMLVFRVGGLRIVEKGEKREYLEARLNWNQAVQHYPSRIYYCNSTSDVQYVIQQHMKQNQAHMENGCFDSETSMKSDISCHHNKNIPFRIRSGRHSYESFSNCDDPCVIIDLSEMKKVEYDDRNGIFKFGAGLKNIEVYHIAIMNNYLFPGGTCPTVGISGYILGGGYGFISRDFGLAIDCVEQMEIVLYDGNVVLANATNQYSDLFWALKGSGHNNYGIVTEFTLRLPKPLIQDFIVYEFYWDSFSRFKAAFHFWQQWAPHSIKNLTPQFTIYNNHFASVGLFRGSNQSELDLQLKDFIQYASPDRMNFKPMTYEDVCIYLSNGCKTMQDCLERAKWTPLDDSLSSWKAKSLFIFKEIPSMSIEILEEYMSTKFQNATTGFAGVLIDCYGGAIPTTRNGKSSSFIARDALYHIQFMIYWNKVEEKTMAYKWINEFYEKLIQSDPEIQHKLHSYINYPDISWREQDNYKRVYYGDNYDRLKEIKSKYDPLNMFHYEEGINIHKP